MTKPLASKIQRRAPIGRRPGADPASAWVQQVDAVMAAAKASVYTARLTIDVTPVMRGRINGQGPVVRPVLFVDAEEVESNTPIPSGAIASAEVESVLLQHPAIAEQPAHMVTAMRRDWDETGTLPVQQAHRRHIEIAREGGFHGVGSDTLNENMSAVVARAKTQGV